LSTPLHAVPADALIKRLAEHLKNIPQVSFPEWALYVKTGSHTTRPPQDKHWWYTRAASVMRKLYLHGPMSVKDLRSEYGNAKQVGYSPKHHRHCGGSHIREILQQLEAAGLVEKVPGKGRVLSQKGMSLLDRLSKEILKEFVATRKELEKYAR